MKLIYKIEEIKGLYDNDKISYALYDDYKKMHAELDRLNKALREAVKEIKDVDGSQLGGLGHFELDGDGCIYILEKHFPELKKEDNNE